MSYGTAPHGLTVRAFFPNGAISTVSVTLKPVTQQPSPMVMHLYIPTYVQTSSDTMTRSHWDDGIWRDGWKEMLMEKLQRYVEGVQGNI